MDNKFYDQGAIVAPFTFGEKNKAVKPFYNIEDELNNREHFAILKTTANGKFVRGDMLFYEFNGVTISTSINNIIFVNVTDRSVTILPQKGQSEITAPVDPEDRQYILLLWCDETNNSEDHYIWRSMTGRTYTYNYIKNNIDNELFNVKKSFVLTENVPYKDALSIYQFINYIKNGNLVEDDDFDIESYVLDDNEEE